MTELKQKRLNAQRHFFLEPDRLRVVVKDLNGEVEAFVDYQNVSRTTRTVTEQNGRLYLVAISLTVFFLVGSILYFFGIPALMRWVPL